LLGDAGHGFPVTTNCMNLRFNSSAVARVTLRRQ
jgi:hypothetical protein